MIEFKYIETTSQHTRSVDGETGVTTCTKAYLIRPCDITRAQLEEWVEAHAERRQISIDARDIRYFLSDPEVGHFEAHTIDALVLEVVIHLHQRGLSVTDWEGYRWDEGLTVRT
jgi:hypothetical protein